MKIFSKLKKIVFLFVICLGIFLPLVFAGCEQIDSGAQQINVTLNQNYANTNATSKLIDKNTTIAELSFYYTANREGYTLKGWSDTKDGVLLPENMKISSSTTLYAVWEINTYILSYDLNGAEGEIPSQSASYNSTVTVYDGSTLIRENYVFDGWFQNKNGNGVKVQSSIVLTSNITLFAKWKGDNVDYAKFVYNFDTNTYSHGSEDTVTTEYGKQITLPLQTKLHYEFLGWNKTPVSLAPGVIDENFVCDYPAGQTVLVDWTSERALNIYEVWRVKTYTLSYLDASGNEQIITKVKYGTLGTDLLPVKFSIPDGYAKTGYTFKNWLSGTSTINAGALLPADQNYKLTAQFEAKNVEVTLIYHGNEDNVSVAGKQTFVFNSKYDAIIDLTSFDEKIDTNNFVFYGWFKNYEDQEPITSITLNNAKLGTGFSDALKVSIYSKVSNQTNKVSFFGETDEEAYKLININYDKSFSYKNLSEADKNAINLNAKIQKLGYTFVGFTDQYGNLYEIGDNFVIDNVIENIVLKATFNVNSYKVTYYLNDDDTILAGNYEANYDSIVNFVKRAEVESKIASRTAVFAGWSFTRGGAIAENNYKMPANEIKLYANWTIFNYDEVVEDTVTTIKITGIFAGVTTSVTTIEIPTTLNGYPVTAIAKNAFKDNKNINKVKIKIGLLEIGESAFENSSIEVLELFANLNAIGSYAFKNSSLITIANVGGYAGTSFAFAQLKDTVLGNEVFAGIARTSAIGAGDSSMDSWKEKFEALYDSNPDNNTIGTGLFKGSKINAINFSNTQITCLSESIFEDCQSLTSSIFYKNGVISNSHFTHFAKHAFKNTVLSGVTTSVTSNELLLPSTLLYLDEGVFEGIETIKEVRIWEEVVTIHASAFKNCSNLEIVGWGSPDFEGYESTIKISQIGASAFEGTAIKYVYIVSTVTEIGENAFANIATLEEIEFEDTHSIIFGKGAFAKCGQVNDTVGFVKLTTEPEGWKEEVYTGTNISDK